MTINKTTNNIQTRTYYKEGEEESISTHHCHSARGILSVDARWSLQIASSFGRKTRRLPDDVVPRGEQNSKVEPGIGREETVTRAGTRKRRGMRTRTGVGAGTGTIVERRVRGERERAREPTKW